ncbi:MAG: hypothetical protein M0039_02050 [Pseudomonadota bacterium]|nr:hypothetical protein [Pseudomonadota bacterium]
MPDGRTTDQVFEEVDARVRTLEQALSARDPLPLARTVDEALALVRCLLRGYIDAHGRVDAAGDDVLELFKVFVRGDPSLNAVRDNIRELVYYRNCIDAGREDALPARPDAMAVRTIRHIYLYLRSRSEQERLFRQD